MTIFAKQALTPSGWKSDVRIEIANGRISGLSDRQSPQSGDDGHDVLLPGMPNLHSHAFQRGMAGLAEIRGTSADNFWSWRDIMYRFALSMTPDQLQAIASQLYVEMLEAGFTRVGEFHYLHHDRSGAPHEDIAEMAGQIASAADQTGIGLTLLPVFYAHSGFGGTAPGQGQRRFINSIDQFQRLLDRCKTILSHQPSSVLGIAPHSLRAVTPEELQILMQMDFDGPIHIHVAEQTKEVDDCIAWSGKRPVQWLLDHADLDARWCLIHATHMTADETASMAKSGSVAGLCPVTEANLGDGTFPATGLIDAGGAFGIGSDSNVLIGIGDELRQLEYSQRLHHRARNVLAKPGQSNGNFLFQSAIEGGATALGAPSGLKPGAPFDAVSLKGKHAIAYQGDAVLDTWIFSNSASVDTVWVAGQKLVQAGRHKHRDAVAAKFEQAMQQLLESI